MIDPGLKGIIAAVLTAVTAKFQIDLPRFEKHIRAMLGQGCSFVSTFGRTGEGASFSAREKRAAHEGLIARGTSPKSLVPAIITTALDDAVQQLKDAVAFGMRRVLVLPPVYYPSAPQKGLIDFLEALYRRLAQRSASSFTTFPL